MKKWFLGFVSLVLLSLSSVTIAVEVDSFDSIKYDTKTTMNYTSDFVFESNKIFVVKTYLIDSNIFNQRQYNVTGENTQININFNSNLESSIKVLSNDLNLPYEVGWQF